MNQLEIDKLKLLGKDNFRTVKLMDHEMKDIV